jgi:ubiquinone/menaquinone biosynthesis C-methylase UbiE
MRGTDRDDSMPEAFDQSLRERTERDAERVRNEYARRATDPRLHQYYARVGAVLARQQADRRARIARALDLLGPRQSVRLLDVGCGGGADLADLVRHGFLAANLVGVDLLDNDLATARKHVPGVRFIRGNAAELPFPDGAFDAVMLITVLSSIVDDVVRAEVAREVVRVVKPNGLILSYDLRIVGDGNPHLVVIDEAELGRLFGSVSTIAMERHALSLRVASRVPAWVANRLSSVQSLLHSILAIIRPGATGDGVSASAENR